MVDSDKSDNGESLQIGKRLLEVDSGDEKIEHPSKRPRSISPESQEKENGDIKKDPIVQVTNGSTLPSKENIDNGKHKNGEAIATDDDTKTYIKDENSTEVKMVAELNEESKEDAEKKNAASKEGKEKEIEEGEEEEDEDIILQDKSKDSEVVDGLELSVECASDKEVSSSESDKEKDSKPRPKTIIVKAKPNDSELEVGSSEAEKSENETEEKEEKNVDTDAKNRKRGGKRKAISKVSSSQSEESQESNSEDEDYSPRTKKKLKKNVTPKKAQPQKIKAKKAQGRKKKPATSESEEERSESGHEAKPEKTKAKKEAEMEKKSADIDSEDEKSESENEETNLAARAKKMSGNYKTAKKDKNESASVNETDSSDDSDDKNKKNGKRKSSKNTDSDNDKIKKFKKYLNTAGIRVKYEELWSGCRTNQQRINRIKTLLEDKGIVGRPTLEKCRKWKVKNATKMEVAELDTSNIMSSEGRVTRARKNQAILGTPPKQREARKILKRIQPVCDSDTE